MAVKSHGISEVQRSANHFLAKKLLKVHTSTFYSLRIVENGLVSFFDICPSCTVGSTNASLISSSRTWDKVFPNLSWLSLPSSPAKFNCGRPSLMFCTEFFQGGFILASSLQIEASSRIKLALPWSRSRDIAVNSSLPFSARICILSQLSDDIILCLTPKLYIWRLLNQYKNIQPGSSDIFTFFKLTALKVKFSLNKMARFKRPSC